MRDKLRLIASGKITNGFYLIEKLAFGADLCNSARGMMFALGCIQALQCNANTCPTGVTTQNPRLVRGLVVESKAQRVANFHRATVESALELAGAMGINHLNELTPQHIFHRVSRAKSVPYDSLYPHLQEGELLDNKDSSPYIEDWRQASSEYF